MTLLEIILILIGVGVIVFSCFLIDKSANEDTLNLDGISKQHITERLSDQFTAAESEIIKSKINKIITETTEDTVVKVDDILSQISNEKIIAVNDYSNQILEKISQNHEEVVFLYNMLNEKQSEIKDTIKLMETKQEQVPETKSKTKAKTKSSKKNQADEEVDEYILSQNSEMKSADRANNNEKILDLYQKGKTVIEISKILGLGQGEVKLVIDLFTNK